MLLVISVLFFVAFGLVGYLASSAVQSRNEAQEQMKLRLGGAVPESEASGRRPTSIVKDLRLSSIEALNDVLSRVGAIMSLAGMMRQAGIRRRVGEVVLLMFLLGAVAALITMMRTRNVAMSLGVGVVSGLLPVFFIRRTRSKRLATFSEQLPDALDLVKAALQAGHSLPTAMRVVADEFAAPISEEFETLAEEIRLGLPMREALKGLNERVPDENLPVLIVGILVVQESGGNLAEVLENVAHTVRERFRLLRDVHTMTAQGRMSGNLLSALPVIVALTMAALVPGYFDPMLRSPTGRLMVAYVAGSILVGYTLVQRIVKIRV